MFFNTPQCLKVGSIEIVRSGKFQIFKGLRVNIYRAVIKDYINMRFYIRIYKYINNFVALQKMPNQNKRKFIASFSTGLIHSVIAGFMMTPFDVMKTFLMCEIATKEFAMYKGFFKMIGIIYAKNGLPTIFNGLKLGILNSMIHSSLIVSTSFYLALDKNVDLVKFVILNLFVSSLCYPIGTLTLNNQKKNTTARIFKRKASARSFK